MRDEALDIFMIVLFGLGGMTRLATMQAVYYYRGCEVNRQEEQ